MSPQLKATLEERAKANGRSLNSEIIARLEESLAGPPRDLAKQPTAEYRVLTDQEQAMLQLYRKWPAPKQLSFLVLFQ